MTVPRGPHHISQGSVLGWLQSHRLGVCEQHSDRQGEGANGREHSGSTDCDPETSPTWNFTEKSLPAFAKRTALLLVLF